MNKNILKNALLLLLIPVVITIFILVLNIDKKDTNTVNKSTVVYNRSTNSRENNRYKNYIVHNKDEGIYVIYNRSYTILFYSAIGVVIIFTIFYFYLTRKKEW